MESCFFLYSSGGKSTAVWNNKAFKYDSQIIIAYLEDATRFEYGITGINMYIQEPICCRYNIICKW